MPDLSLLGRRLAENPPLAPSPRRRLEERWGRRRRRGLAAAGVAVAGVVGLVVGVIVSASGGTRVEVIAPPVAGLIQPVRPTALAVGRDGGLYVADPQLNEILERLHNGSFAVVAGTGQPGFSGDGGPAARALLNDPSGMTVGPDGTLYFADQGNNRVRAIGLDGVIRTVAGGGTEGRSGFVRGGTPALSAMFSPSDVAFGPGGRLYIATGEQVVRLEANGTLTPVLGAPPGDHQGLWGVGGPAVDGSADGANGIAFDSAGNLYVAGFNTKSLLLVRPDGILEQISASFYPRGDGGLVATPGGGVVAMQVSSIASVTPSGLRTIITFGTGIFEGTGGFSPNGIAVGSDGTIYVDTYSGNGYASYSAIAAVSPTSWSLLWDDRATRSPVDRNGPDVLRGNGIGEAIFGQGRNTVVATLRRVLGRAASQSSGETPAACGVDATVHWTDLDTYFFEGRFVGYSTHTRRLATAAGLRVGDSLFTAQHMYESAVVTSYEQGGAWFVATASGELMGYLSGVPAEGPAGPKIVTIEAGTVGCPAQTP